MRENNLSRRTVLESVAVGVSSVGFAGTVAGQQGIQEPEILSVGTRYPPGEGAWSTDFQDGDTIGVFVGHYGLSPDHELAVYTVWDPALLSGITIDDYLPVDFNELANSILDAHGTVERIHETEVQPNFYGPPNEEQGSNIIEIEPWQYEDYIVESDDGTEYLTLYVGTECEGRGGVAYDIYDCDIIEGTVALFNIW